MQYWILMMWVPNSPNFPFSFCHLFNILNYISHLQLNLSKVVEADHVCSNIESHFISFHSCSFLFIIHFQCPIFVPMQNQITPTHFAFRWYTRFTFLASISRYLSRFSLIFLFFHMFCIDFLLYRGFKTREYLRTRVRLSHLHICAFQEWPDRVKWQKQSSYSCLSIPHQVFQRTWC
jgi:hypothetical protein